jgi:predicted amidohydrolase
MKKVRIAALQGPEGKVSGPVTVEKNVEWTAGKVRELARFGVDIVCLAEVFKGVGTPLKPAEYAEAVPGPLTKTFTGLARELGLAIICPMYERRGGKIYNTAVAISRTGKIVGQYDKIHPTAGEMEDGVVPGKLSPTVIRLDGIKVAGQICYDANWPEDWVNQKKAGAEIIFFCSAFSAGTLLQSYATVLNVPVVASTWCRHCRIYDRTGRQIAHQTPYFDYAMADVLIDQPLFHLDMQWQNLEKIRKDHPELSTEVFDGEGRWTITGDPKVIQKVIEKYKIVDIDEYLSWAQKKQDVARGKSQRKKS